jgi:hypothetical protein
MFLPRGHGRLGAMSDGQNSIRRRDRAWAWVFSAVAHAVIFAVVFWPRARPPAKPVPPVPSMMVSLLDLPRPPGPPDPPAAPTDGARQMAQLPQPRPAVAAPVAVAMAPPAPDTSDLLSDAQLAGAASAGEGGGAGGGGGGGCDMAGLVQQALRRDPLVRAAVAGADRLGRASMLWNGDWVQSGGQDGKGLSAVREAVTWEVAFAPEACRNQQMHGLVLLSLGDGTTRFAIGAGDWRWSQLLGVRRMAARR